MKRDSYLVAKSSIKYVIVLSFMIFGFALQGLCAEDGGVPQGPAYSKYLDETQLRSELGKVLEMENRNPTSAQNVKKRFFRFMKLLQAMLDSGRSVKEILSRQDADRIESLLRAGNDEEAAKMFRDVMQRIKQYNSSAIDNTTKIEPAVAIVVKSPADIKEFTADFSQGKGVFPDYLFGTLVGPRYMESGYALAKEAGFKLIEVKIDIDAIDKKKMEHFQKSVKAAFDIHAHPLIWFLISKGTKPAAGVLSQNTDKILRMISDINPAYAYLIRIGNEPDNRAYWKGTKQEFFESYAEIAGVIKKFNPKYVVGGLALANGCSFRIPGGLNCSSLNDWLTDFLEYAKLNSLPVDFVTVHGYSAIGYRSFYNQFRLIAELLNKYPGLSPLFGTPKLGNDEWNIAVGDLWSGAYNNLFNTAWTAAANVNAWIAMVDNGLWLSVRYGGTFNDAGDSRDKAKGHDFPLTHADGSKKPVFYALKGLNELAGYTNIKVTGSDYLNFAAIAGKDSNKSVSVVMGNFDVDTFLNQNPDSQPQRILRKEYQGILKEKNRAGAERYDRFKLLIKNMPWQSKDIIVYETYVIDDSSNGIHLVERKELGGKNEISLDGTLRAPAVYILKLYKK